MKNYGMASVGKHVVVSLVLNASNVDVQYLEQQFPELMINTYEYGSTYRVKIEGCVLHSKNWHAHYEYAKAMAVFEDAQMRLVQAMDDLKRLDAGLMKANIDGEEILVKYDPNVM